jgi:hypothetical protein
VVPEGYEYHEKVITPREGLSLPGAYLKWYDLYPPDVEITPEQLAETRDFLAAEAKAGQLKLENELGFVILHRAGPMLLLLVTTWRNTNEMWESVYVKEAASQAGYRPLHFETSHWGTYCVWELGAVWHERNAWVRFIRSRRDDEAKLAYLNDSYSGQI